MDTTHNQEPIKLKNLIIRLRHAFLRLWPLILALSVGVGALSYVRGQRNFVPMYESTAIFTVDAAYLNDDIFNNTAYYDQYAARSLAEVLPQILPTQAMRDLILQVIPKGYINGSASVSSVADSNLVVLRVKSSNPQDAYDYLSAIVKCYPQILQYVASNPKVRVMQPPVVPTEPYNTFDGSYAAIRGGIVGLAAGLALMVAYALLVRTVQSGDELKSAINLPIIVSLPKVTAKKRRKKTAGLLTADADPNLAESFRGLRVKVKKLVAPTQKKVILVTSTIAGEGKTTVSINLAQSLVSDGHKVLLLDADLRNQSVARALGEKATGYSLLDCLRDPDISVLDLIRTVPGSKLEYVSGRSTDAQHYTVNPRSLDQLLELLALRYDYIVMDTAPCEVVSDTASMCRCAGCVLYVVRQDHAHIGQILNAVTTLHHKDVRITGCVFNGVPQNHRHYGYGYGYSYGYKKYSYSYHYSKYSYSHYAAPKD